METEGICNKAHLSQEPVVDRNFSHISSLQIPDNHYKPRNINKRPEKFVAQ